MWQSSSEPLTSVFRGARRMFPNTSKKTPARFPQSSHDTAVFVFTSLQTQQTFPFSWNGNSHF